MKLSLLGVILAAETVSRCPVTLHSAHLVSGGKGEALVNVVPQTKSKAALFPALDCPQEPPEMGTPPPVPWQHSASSKSTSLSFVKLPKSSTSNSCMHISYYISMVLQIPQKFLVLQMNISPYPQLFDSYQENP